MNNLGDRVSILHLYDPFTFWLKCLEDQRYSTLPQVTQAGLHGIVPSELDVIGSEWVYMAVDEWSEAAIISFKNLLKYAQAIYFKKSYQQEYSLFDGLPNIFGIMTVQLKNGQFLEVHEELIRLNRGLRNNSMWRKKHAAMSYDELNTIKRLLFPQSFSTQDHLSRKRAVTDNFIDKANNSPHSLSSASSNQIQKPSKLKDLCLRDEEPSTSKAFSRTNEYWKESDDYKGDFRYEKSPNQPRQYQNQRNYDEPSQNRYGENSYNSVQSQRNPIRRPKDDEEDERNVRQSVNERLARIRRDAYKEDQYRTQNKGNYDTNKSRSEERESYVQRDRVFNRSWNADDETNFHRPDNERRNNYNRGNSYDGKDERSQQNKDNFNPRYKPSDNRSHPNREKSSYNEKDSFVNRNKEENKSNFGARSQKFEYDDRPTQNKNRSSHDENDRNKDENKSNFDFQYKNDNRPNLNRDKKSYDDDFLQKRNKEEKKDSFDFRYNKNVNRLNPNRQNENSYNEDEEVSRNRNKEENKSNFDFRYKNDNSSDQNRQKESSYNEDEEVSLNRNKEENKSNFDFRYKNDNPSDQNRQKENSYNEDEEISRNQNKEKNKSNFDFRYKNDNSSNQNTEERNSYNKNGKKENTSKLVALMKKVEFDDHPSEYKNDERKPKNETDSEYEKPAENRNNSLNLFKNDSDEDEKTVDFRKFKLSKTDAIPQSEISDKPIENESAEIEKSSDSEKINEEETKSDTKNETYASMNQSLEISEQNAGSDIEFEFEKEEEEEKPSIFTSVLSKLGLGSFLSKAIPSKLESREVSPTNTQTEDVTKENKPETEESESPEETEKVESEKVDTETESNVKKSETEKITSRPDILSHTNYDEDIPVWNNLSDCTFMNVTLNNLDRMKIKMCNIFGNVWPSVAEMRNSLVVGSKSNMALLVPLCDSIFEKSELKKLLIICPDDETANQVRKICNNVTRNMKFIVNKNNDLDADIIIISIKHFNIETLKGLKDVKTVTFISVHNFHQQFNNYFDYVMKIFPSAQINASSQLWCDWMKRALNLLPNCSVFIENHMDSFVYGKCLLDLHLSSRKIDTLISLLKTNPTSGKTVIFCSDSQLDEIHDVIKENNIFCLRSDYREEEMAECQKKWMLENAVLVITDTGFQVSGSFNANRLINLCASDNLRMYDKRFSVLLAHIPNIVKNKEAIGNNVKVEIVLDENDLKPLPKIIKFANRCGISIPENLLNLSKYFIHFNETNKFSRLTPVCKELMLYGECLSKNNCDFRHWLSKEDCLPDDMITDDIRFQIISIQNPCQYVVRILEYKTPEGVLKQHDKSYLPIGLDILKHGLQAKNKKPIANPEIGQICLFINQLVMSRVEIYSISENNQIGVNFIDTCTSGIVHKSTLFEYPVTEESQDLFTMTVRLADMIPTYRVTKNELTDSSTNSVFRGSVVLGFNNTLYLSSFQRCECLKNSKSVVVLQNIKADLIQNKAIKENLGQIDKLKKCLEYFNLEQSIRISKIKSKQNFKPQWAHLEDGINEVLCPNVDENGVIFLTINKNSDLIEKLQEEIQKYVAEFSKEVPKDWIVGDYCIGKFEDKFFRAKLIKVEEDSVLCFFVDYGDYDTVSFEDLYPITNELVMKLPFQAIECVLYGLRNPVKIDYLYDYLQGPDAFVYTLYAKYIEKTKALITDGNRYAIAVKKEGDQHAINRTIAINHAVSVYGNLDNLAELENAIIETKKNTVDDEDWELDNSEEHFDRVPLDDFESDEDEEMDVEIDEDMMNKFKNACKMMGINPDPVPETTVQISEVTEEETTEEVIIPEILEAIKEPNDDSNFEIINSNDMNEVRKFLNMKKPNITWHETKSHIFLNIKLIDMTLYTLYVNNQLVTFEAEADGHQYGFHLDLYGCVKSKHTHKHIGNCVKVQLEKAIETTWKQLTISKVKKSWISYNFDHLEDSEAVDLTSFGINVVNKNDCNILEDIDSDDDGEGICDDETEF